MGNVSRVLMHEGADPKSGPEQQQQHRSKVWAQYSGLPFSNELRILSRVFLMRSAVSRADGFWYQHSFISFTRAESVWGKKNKNAHKSGGMSQIYNSTKKSNPCRKTKSPRFGVGPDQLLLPGHSQAESLWSGVCLMCCVV